MPDLRPHPSPIAARDEISIRSHSAGSCSQSMSYSHLKVSFQFLVWLQGGLFASASELWHTRISHRIPHHCCSLVGGLCIHAPRYKQPCLAHLGVYVHKYIVLPNGFQRPTREITNHPAGAFFKNPSFNVEGSLTRVGKSKSNMSSTLKRPFQTNYIKERKWMVSYCESGCVLDGPLVRLSDMHMNSTCIRYSYTHPLWSCHVRSRCC